MNILEKAKAIRKLIKQHQNIYIVGHENLDLDALGSAIGIYYIVERYHRQPYIILDDESHELGVNKIISEQEKLSFITSKQLIDKANSNDLLIIVDTNKASLLSNPKLVDQFDHIILIDHHQSNEKSIRKGLIVIDQNTSSTCQMIAELFYYHNIKVTPEIATIILSGIVLDTNNFVLKTNAKTYFSAYYLTSQGADPKKVQYYLKQDITDYILRQKAITNVEVIQEKYAITTTENNIFYRREELAKIADTLLQFNGIESSFVLGRLTQDTIGLSARSEGILDSGKIAESFGGGGDHHDAAAQIEGRDLNNLKEKLTNLIQ